MDFTLGILILESLSVCQSHTTCASYNLAIHCSMDFKLGILIDINVQMIPFAWKVSSQRSRSLSGHLDFVDARGISVS